MKHREIKFRTWNGFQMLYEFSLNSQDGDIFYSHEFRSYPVMQFIGLKDRNGKEIYERDIVRGGEFEGDHDTKLYEIVYNEDGSYPAFDLKGWRSETNGICFFLNVGYLEIIGNIYENPDLLSPQKKPKK